MRTTARSMRSISRRRADRELVSQAPAFGLGATNWRVDGPGWILWLICWI